MILGDWTFRVFTDGLFRLDGGSMFGVVPRVMWQKHHPADETNRIQLTLRCLLAESSNKRVLVDTGIGDSWDEKGKKIFAIERQPHHLLGELKDAGVDPASITDVVLTHLHFDHCGGAVQTIDEGSRPTFPQARHWVQQQHWDWACNPTERDRASFRPTDFKPLLEAGLLEKVDGAREIMPGIRVTPISGHTPGQQMVEFHTDAGVVVYCADLIPFASQVHVPWIMGFDLNPLLTLNEKKEFLSRAAEEGYVLVFEHDPVIEAGVVGFNNGKFELAESFNLDER
jgi:glyoxylase-like metal-dependent hydrolase (beta-lactamase superfamily II)